MWCRVFGRGEGIRTPGPMLPKHVRYQTALHPGFPCCRPCLSGDVLYNTRSWEKCQPLFHDFFENFETSFSLIHLPLRTPLQGLFQMRPS